MDNLKKLIIYQEEAYLRTKKFVLRSTSVASTKKKSVERIYKKIGSTALEVDQILSTLPIVPEHCSAQPGCTDVDVTELLAQVQKYNNTLKVNIKKLVRMSSPTTRSMLKNVSDSIARSKLIEETIAELPSSYSVCIAK